MNQKYILYIYDTILTEINSLEIISEQTFIKYLDECSSESKLYFKIEIIKKNGKSKYTIDKPTHTLHPKTPKFLCDIATKNSFYKGIFAKILDDIKLEYGNNNVNWYSEKDSTAFFLSIDFELKFLSKKELYFLYCFQKLLKENQRIKKN